MVAGMFLALGQDPAQVTTSCSTITNYELNDDGESVNFTVAMFRILVNFRLFKDWVTVYGCLLGQAGSLLNITRPSTWSNNIVLVKGGPGRSCQQTLICWPPTSLVPWWSQLNSVDLRTHSPDISCQLRFTQCPIVIPRTSQASEIGYDVWSVFLLRNLWCQPGSRTSV